MANTLLITKLSDGSFSFVVNGDVINTIINLRNDLTTVGNECHFKTSEGANLIKLQQILYHEVTIVDGATLPVASSPLDLRIKLISVGFWDWMNPAGGGGSNRFDLLLDAFSYFGNNGKIPMVDESQLKLIPYSLPDFSYLNLFPNPLVADKGLKVNSLATAYELYDIVNTVTQFIRLGYTATAPSEDIVYKALELKANLSDIPVLPDDYANIVYVNGIDPNLATIFDLNNPPTVNDNSLKEGVSNLYIGTDASTWVYNLATSNYVTKVISSEFSNFDYEDTDADATGNKTAAIERYGTIGGAPGTASNHFVTKAQLDLKENLSNKQNSLAIDGTGTKYPTVDAVNAVLPMSFTKVVYVNAVDPNIATIFDLNNPPITNDDLLKADTNNLYIGTDSTTWTYKTSPAGYNTYSAPPMSNFVIFGTSLDAGSSKTVSISRSGNLSLTGETANTIASFDTNKSIKSLPLATYPSLSELSFVKGLTSSVQTQINARALDNNVVHLSGNETRSNGSLTFRTNTNANALILIDPLAQAITAYNTSNVISWRLTNLGASQGNGSLGTASSFFYWREAGGNQLGASVQLTVPPATVAGSALNKGQFDAVLLASVSAVLDFPATATGTNSDLTIAYTGAVLGDMVILGSPIPVTGSMYTAFVSDVGVVTVRLNNYSVASVNPASGTFKVKIIR